MRNGLTLRLDTSKEGIEAVFKPWQYGAVEILLEANEEHSSNEMHTRLLNRDFKISRASVIFFLNGLVLAKLATFREESSKGGYKRIYKIPLTRTMFNDQIVNIFCQKLYEAFPDIEWLKEIWEDE